MNEIRYDVENIENAANAIRTKQEDILTELNIFLDVQCSDLISQFSGKTKAPVEDLVERLKQEMRVHFDEDLRVITDNMLKAASNTDEQDRRQLAQGTRGGGGDARPMSM